MNISKWIKYWRDSLADAESINIDISKVAAQYKTDIFNFNETKIPEEIFNVLWPENEIKALKQDQVLDKEISSVGHR